MIPSEFGLTFFFPWKVSLTRITKYPFHATVFKMVCLSNQLFPIGSLDSLTDAWRRPLSVLFFSCSIQPLLDLCAGIWSCEFRLGLALFLDNTLHILNNYLTVRYLNFYVIVKLSSCSAFSLHVHWLFWGFVCGNIHFLDTMGCPDGLYSKFYKDQG